MTFQSVINIREKNKAEKRMESAGNMVKGLREGNSKQSSQEWLTVA